MADEEGEEISVAATASEPITETQLDTTEVPTHASDATNTSQTEVEISKYDDGMEDETEYETEFEFEDLSQPVTEYDVAEPDGEDTGKIDQKSEEKKTEEVVEDNEDEDEQLNIFGEARGPLGPYVTFSESIVVEEEEPESSYLAKLHAFQDYKEPIDREYFVEEFRKLTEERTGLRRKNGYLNRKMAEYFRKRKMEHVFDEVPADQLEELINRYDRKIDEFYEYRIKACAEKETIENEIKEMKEYRDEQYVLLNKDFNSLVAREKEVATGLIDSKSGKIISDKEIERLITRQRQKSNEIAEIRLIYYKRRDKVREIEIKLKKLETIGDNLHLMDFEQLRMDNQTFTDKIEERDEELMRLRDRFSNAVHAIAHLREKCNIMEDKIGDKKEKTMDIEEEVSICREKLNALKLERDKNRAQAEKIRNNSGLLLENSLLCDFEHCLKEVDILRNHLDELIAINKERRKKLISIRNTIEHTKQTTQKAPKVLIKTMKTQRIYRNRPTLVYPQLPEINLETVPYTDYLSKE